MVADHKSRILNTARKQFTASGFSKITADEIAAALGMSKKTLYKHFRSKNELLRAVLESILDEMGRGAERILVDETREFTDKVQALLTHIGSYVSTYLTPTFLRDIKRHAPELWTRIEQFREEQVNTKFARLIKEGIGKGVFRKDVDEKLVVLVYFNAVQKIINPETLSELPYTAAQAFKAIIRIIFDGILTDEGRARFNSIRNKT